MKKLKKKDKVMYDQIQKKLIDLVENPDHFKPSKRYKIRSQTQMNKEEKYFVIQYNEKLKNTLFVIQYNEK